MTGSLIVVGMIVLLTLTSLVSLRLFGPQRAEAAHHLDPADETELDAAFARVHQEEGQRTRAHLDRTLERLVTRRVPLCRIESAVAHDIARLAFADGTVLLARSGSAGSVGLLARSCLRVRVHPSSRTSTSDQERLELVWPTGKAWVDVVGGDQVD